MNAPSKKEPSHEGENKELNSANHLFANSSDPVITYNHMDEESSFRKRYFSKDQHPSEFTIWPLLFEELVIALMLVLLFLTT